MQHPKLSLTIPWEHIDLAAQQQIIRVLAMPELVKLAIMPDVHAGYDLCIGGVALLREVISPSFVGYDIGCGMCHVNTKTSLSKLGLSSRKEQENFFTRLQALVPAGVGRGHRMASELEFVSASGDRQLDKKIAPFVYSQLGTLGSGNHFLELGVNSQDEVGLTIHSGSRRVGYDIASYYMRKGNILKLNSENGQAYKQDMDWALEFALENRRVMLKSVLSLLGFSKHTINKMLLPDSMINENHNHAVVQGDLVLHRKGATPAEKGKYGIIPANQRDGVWVTTGLGNEEFLFSASHGAGRKFSRKVAANHGTVKELEKLMQGVVCRTDRAILDEAPWAYKNIGDVLEAQAGVLIDIVDHFKPVIVLKGA